MSGISIDQVSRLRKREGEDAKGGKGDYERIDGLEFLSSEMRFCKRSKRPCHRNLVRVDGTRAWRGGWKLKKSGWKRKKMEKSPATLAGAGKFVLLSRGADKFLQSRVFHGRETRPSRDDQRFLDRSEILPSIAPWRNHFSRILRKLRTHSTIILQIRIHPLIISIWSNLFVHKHIFWINIDYINYSLIFRF